MRFSETRLDRIQASDGFDLDIHIWEPQFPTAIFVAVHGGLAHGGDWVTPALYFKDLGIATAACDLRGHKQKKVCIETFDQLLEDTAHFIRWVKEKYPDLPVFYLGHSIGALIGTHIGLRFNRHPYRLNGFIFSSPYYENAIKTNPLVIPIIKFMSWFLPNLTIPNMILTDKLTRDREIVERHNLDEKDGLRATKTSVRFGSEILNAQEWVKENIQKWTTPLFVAVAGKDEIADSNVTRQLLKQVNQKVLTCVMKENNFHENFNELDRKDTFLEIHKWMTIIIDRNVERQ